MDQGKKKAIGMALYSLAVSLSEDFVGTLEQLAKIGYSKLEFAGPYYYSSKEEIEQNFLIKQMGLKGYGYHNHSPKDLHRLLQELGMTTPSAHVSLESLEHNLEEAINAAHILGHQFLVCPFFLGTSLDDYKAIADKFNTIGEACAKADIRFLYHNHSFEFGPIDGKLPMEVLLERTEAKFVSFELDLFWATVAGANPLTYFEKYPGRFPLLHFKDMGKEMEAPNTDWQTFTQPEKAMAIMQQQVAVGSGIINFKEILGHFDHAGTQHFFVEADFPAKPLDFARESFKLLSKIIA